MKQPGLWCDKYHSLTCSASPPQLHTVTLSALVIYGEIALDVNGEIRLRSLVMPDASFDIKEEND